LIEDFLELPIAWRILLRGHIRGFTMLIRVIGILMFTAAISVAGPALPAPTYGAHLEKTWIPMKDGVRLAVTLYMPVGEESRAHVARSARRSE
jgi:predicted acyl esterase